MVFSGGWVGPSDFVGAAMRLKGLDERHGSMSLEESSRWTFLALRVSNANAQVHAIHRIFAIAR